MSNSKQNRSVLLSVLTMSFLFFVGCRSQVEMSNVGAVGSLGAQEGSDGGDSTNQTNSTPNPSSPPTQILPPNVPAPAPTPAPSPTPPSGPNPFDPGNPNVGLLPTEGEWASIAFEDNIADPNAGDRDYNDAVFNYRIAELYNSESQLVRIDIEIRLREKISGNDHRLYFLPGGSPGANFSNIQKISMPAFNGEADASVSYSDGTVLNVQSVQDQVVNVFKQTSGMKNTVTKIQINIKNPELNVNSGAKVVDFKKYRFILQNISQTSQKLGIDIAEINPSSEMLSNGNGYPFGFMIPTDWTPPDERQLIDNRYPNFFRYREWLNSDQSGEVPDSVKYWYRN